MKQLLYSPISEKVYFGNAIPSKTNPLTLVLQGQKIDVTQSFYDVLLQKFPSGGTYIITEENGNPVYEVRVRERNQ